MPIRYKDLIETNIRQRGIGNPNPVKLGRCIRELERIYGVERGGDRKSNTNNSVLISQTDIADKLGISVDTLQNYNQWTCQNGTTSKLTLNEIAQELNISKRK